MATKKELELEARIKMLEEANDGLNKTVTEWEDKYEAATTQLSEYQNKVKDSVDKAKEDGKEEAKKEFDIKSILSNPSEETKKLIDILVESKIKERVAGTTPKNTVKKSDIITKEQFKAMDYKQKCNLYNTNREVYDSLVKD